MPSSSNRCRSTGASGLHPPGTVRVFTRDSIDWIAAQTVGDLLATVSGVYIQRGGGYGRPEMPTYRGGGPGSVEFVVDGMPFAPVGDDSLAVDPALFSLALLDRVETTASPAMLRVQLWTRRHDRQAARTKIGFSTGDLGLARYLASYERRYPSGLGVTSRGRLLRHQRAPWRHWRQSSHQRVRAAELPPRETSRCPGAGPRAVDSP